MYMAFMCMHTHVHYIATFPMPALPSSAPHCPALAPIIPHPHTMVRVGGWRPGLGVHTTEGAWKGGYYAM